MNIEIVNQIPQEDLNYIAQKFKDGELAELQTIGRGSFGKVYGYKDYAIKRLFDETNEKNRDIAVLKDISHLECIPTLYATIDNKLLISERIYGKTVEMYSSDISNPYNIDDRIIEDWHNALFSVIREGYSPDDVHENNVMISRDGELKIVDVGWFFKHGCEPNHFDDDSVKNEYGYERAEQWAGYHLKRYINRLEMERQRTYNNQNQNAHQMAMGYGGL
jgi:RIO-like serine/threonine protein kinase